MVIWIETKYNRTPRQRVLGRLTPIEFETIDKDADAAWPPQNPTVNKTRGRLGHAPISIVEAASGSLRRWRCTQADRGRAAKARGGVPDVDRLAELHEEAASYGELDELTRRRELKQFALLKGALWVAAVQLTEELFKEHGRATEAMALGVD